MYACVGARMALHSVQKQLATCMAAAEKTLSVVSQPLPASPSQHQCKELHITLQTALQIVLSWLQFKRGRDYRKWEVNNYHGYTKCYSVINQSTSE